MNDGGARLIKDPAQEEINLVLKFFNSHKLAEAKKELDKQLNKYPNSSILYNIKGAIFAAQNNFESAIKNYNKSIKINPNYAQAYNNLGVCFYKSGKTKEAIKNYNEAIKILPNHADAYNNLGSVFKNIGENTKSLACFQKAIEIQPNHADAYNNLGTILKEQGENEKSLTSFKKAIQIQPNHADAHNNLGTFYKDLKDYKKSIYHYEKSININPKSPVSYSNIGNLYKALGDYEKSISWHQKSIEADSKYVDAYYNIGNVFSRINKFDEANKNYIKAIEIKPDHIANSNLLFNKCWSNNDKKYLEIAKKYNKSIKKQDKENFKYIKKFNKEILNIGFVSGDFRNHSVAFFLLDTLKHLKEKNLKLFAYSNNSVEDSLTQTIKKYFYKWLKVVHKTDVELTETIRRDNIDILFDLSGHTANNRLSIFKNRCAPIQATWCGWLASTGISEMDYIIGDKYATPLENKDKFTEKIYQLKKIWQCFSTSDLNFDLLPIKDSSEKHVVFGSFVNNSKINENVIEIWRKILNEIPKSKLYLKCSSFDIELARKNFIERINKKINIKQLIIEGSSSRLDYFDCYNKIDIVLDTFPSSGATTSFEASYMGVPILTKIKNDNFWFRTGESINKNLSLNDWIAKDNNDYIQKAIKFSENKKNLIELKRELRSIAQKSSLFDSKSFSDDFYEMLLNIKK